MNRLEKAFAGKQAFIGFLTAGDPSFADTKKFILAMEEAGLDIVELGVPFSDPVAEGPKVQEANIRALSGGATLSGVLDMIASLRTESQIPLVLLTYLNPLFSYGYEAFFARCKEAGVDGVIIPDLPYDEKAEVEEYAKANGVAIISLLAPFSADRVRMIAAEAEGYAYIMPPPANASGKELGECEMLSIVRSVTKTPAVIEVDASSPAYLKGCAGSADGVILGGNVFVSLIEKFGKDAAEAIKAYIRDVKAAF